MYDFLSNIKEEDGRTKLLALFLGAHEFYGSNKNGDSFLKQDLIEYHPTFKKFGKVYRHHKNKNPKDNFFYC